MPDKPTKKILIIGYGNPDREDDGVAWHVLIDLARRLGQPVPTEYQEGFPETDDNPRLFFDLQLMPEFSEMVAESDTVIFIDAHTGAIPEDLIVKRLTPEYQKSPFTHHMTPETCLSLAETVYGKTPEAYLVAIHGFQFRFANQLSPLTEVLALEAADRIMKLIEDDN
jgi:hydrogenase maturation protease